MRSGLGGKGGWESMRNVVTPDDYQRGQQSSATDN